MSVGTTARAAAVTLGIAGTAAAVWGIGVERHLYVLRNHTLAILPPGSDPIRILHLSDVHMAPWQARKQAWIASLASLQPDLIVNTGDNLGHPAGLAGIKAAFAGFHGIPGFCVFGSNDVYAPSPRNPLRYLIGPSKGGRKAVELDHAALTRYFADDLGWTSVDNAAGTVSVRGHQVDAFGLGDAHRGWDRLDLLPSLAAGLRAASDSTQRLTLGITHAPYRRDLDAFVEEGADLLLAGHTHGGQVRVPGIGALVANCDIPLSQARGLSSWTAGGRTVPLNVSAGIGHSIYAPVRFACRPEASLLSLVPRER